MSRLHRFVAAFVVAASALPAGGEMRVVADAPLTGPDRYPIAAAVDPVARKAFLRVGGPLSPIAVAIDLDTLASRDVALPSPPIEMLVDSAHGRVYTLHGDLGYFDYEGGRISVIDTRDETVVTDHALEAFGFAMTADFGRRELYVPDGWSGVTTIDADTFAINSVIDVGTRAAGVAVDRVRQRFFLANIDTPGQVAAAVAMVDRRTGSVSTHPLGFGGRGGASGSVAARALVDEHAGFVYVQRNDGQLAILQPPSYEVAHGFAFGDYVRPPERSSLSEAWGRYFQVAYANVPPCTVAAGCMPPAPGDATLRAVTGATGQVATTVLPMRARFGSGVVVADDDGGDLYVVLGAPARAVLRIDPASLEVRETLASPDFDAYVAFREPVTQRLFLLGTNRVQAIDTRGAKAGTRIAHSYRHDAFDHYFVTADPVESRLVDDGRHGSDWVPGEDLFRVWTEPVAGSVPVCRLFSARFAPQSSHVYTPHASECEALKRSGDWQYEGVAFHVALPDASGACPAGTEPLYRLYNEGAGGAPNHRYTASPEVVAAMAARGWSAEGVGPERVFACTPALR